MGSWKRVLGRFVLLLRSSGFTRQKDEGRDGCYVYDKANVAVIVTRNGIPVIRGTGGRDPGNGSVQALKNLWDQAKKAAV